MEDKKVSYKTIDEYIAQCSPDVQPILNQIRATIHEAAPQAAEKISYQMPGFYLQGMLVWFGAFKDHISFFPTGAGVAAFKDELSAYKIAKGTIQFPLDRPIPYDLITRIVKHRVAENTKKKSTT
jgi:uncharacterized protein YdhG (YjbR/CyaY superfamily)